MKKIFQRPLIFISIFFINIPNVFAQDLAQEFLEGLPESVREGIEVQNEVAEDEELEALFRSETSISKNKVILKKLEDQLDALKAMMDPDESDNEKSIVRYGSSFFSSIQSSFMPINAPNLGADYLVDVSDEFELMLTGKTNKKGIKLSVQRDGSLVIPEIGKVYVAGKKLGEVSELVSSFISQASIGQKSFLTLTGVRDVQILLLGGVESPGIYTLSGGSSILGALNVAGGVSEEGSYRAIQLIRNGEVIKEADLYDIFVFGKFDPKNTLRSGDTIFVKPTALKIPVTGGVNRPAIYEAKPDETIGDVITYAGGFDQSFFGYQHVHLQKVTIKGSKLLEVPINQMDQVQLQPRDSIIVPYFSNAEKSVRSATIEGMVRRPGTYYIEENETVEDLINKAGGFKDNAYIFGSALMRESAIEKQKQFAQMNYADTVNYIISSMGKPGGGSGASLDLLVEELRAQPYTGRVILDLSDSIGADVLLDHNDRIVVPQLPNVVYMFGDFKNPANIAYKPELTVKDYLEFAGGLKKSAYNELVIIDPDGISHIYKIGLLQFNSNIDVYPGSIIYAPRDIGKLSGITYAAAVSPILSSLALSLASLNSISNN